MNRTHKRFKIKSIDSKYWFWVCVYDKQEQMQKEAGKFDELRGMALKSRNLLGILQPYERFFTEKDTQGIRHENIGIIRLNKESLSGQVVAHELLHAAFWNYRIEYGKANFGKQCSEAEEDLAYIYGQLFSDISIKLYKHKLWK